MSTTEFRFGGVAEAGEAGNFGANLVVGCCSLAERHGIVQQVRTSGDLLLTYFRAPKNFQSTQVRVGNNTVATATPSLVRMGLWTADSLGSGALVNLVASTANDTTVFNTGNGTYLRSWSAAVNLTKGQWYAFGVLVVSAVAMPGVLGPVVGGAVTSVGLSSLPRLVGVVPAQANLPTSLASGSVSATVNAGPWGEIV